MFIGETNYCALVVDNESFLSNGDFFFFHKEIDPQELRSNVISLVIRTTVQLEQLGFSFQKRENTRILEQSSIVIHFYLYKTDFYAAMSRPNHEYTTEETTLAANLHNILQNTSRPLYTKMKAEHFASEDDNTFEVDEEEEPPYKKMRTPVFNFSYLLHGPTGNSDTSISVPHSFPRPDPKSFIKNYAPDEPLILLPNSFLVTKDLTSLVDSLEGYLTRENITFSSSGSSWNGIFTSEYGSTTSFRICVYKSKKFTGNHILEVQRKNGDGFVFGDFYNNLKNTVRA